MNKIIKTMLSFFVFLLSVGLVACKDNGGRVDSTKEYLTVTFETNGGSVIAPMTVEEGSKLTLPAPPTKAGYDFSDWYIDSSLTTAFDNTKAISSNMTLYAKWLAIYTITFETNGGSVIAPMTIKEGNKLVLPASPAKDGYDFDGWYTNSSLTTAFDNTKAISNNMTLYAKWLEKAKEHLVTFVLNYEGAEDVTYSTTNGLITYIPVRKGYVFNGWWLSDGKALDGSYILSQKYDTSVAVSEDDLVLYAEWVLASVEDSQLSAPSISISGNAFTWKAIKNAQGYRILVYKSGSTNAEIDTITTDTMWTFPDYFDAGYYVVKIRANGDGINTVNSSYVSKSYGNRILATIATIKIDIATSILSWTPVRNATGYELYINNTLVDTITSTTYDLSNYEAGSYNVKITATRSGYISSTKSSTIYKKKLLAPSLSIKANDDGAYEISWNQVSNADIYILKLNGKEIRLGECKYAIAKNSDLWADSNLLKLTLCAFDSHGDYLISNPAEYTLEKRLYTIEGNDPNAGLVATTNDTYVYGEKITIEASTNPGYTFCGWYDGDKLLTSELVYSFTMPNENKIFTARWSRVIVEGNKLDAGTITNLNNTYMLGDRITITAKANSGYTFCGWYDGDKLLTGELAYSFTMPNENKTYTARWSKVSVDSNNLEAGTITNLNKTYMLGDMVTIAAKTNPGYTWLGWYDGDDLLTRKLDYQFEMTADDKIYTARWSKVSVDSNNLKAGTITNLDKAYLFGEKVTITANSNPGYTFCGWYDGDDLLTIEPSYTFEMTADDKLFVAKWTWNGTKFFKTAGYYYDGNYIYFGEYPQTIKSSEITITDTKDSRGYYLGSDGEYYAKVKASYEGSNYQFNDGNEIIKGITYYFKVEPIKWRVLTTNGQYATVICDNILDSGSFSYDNSSGKSNNNYKQSYIRSWLNNTFYNNAFNTIQQDLIKSITVDNSARSTNPDNNAKEFGNGKNENSCDNTTDKLWLPSIQEITTVGYGFNSSYKSADAARIRISSDYSRALGITMNEYDDSANWWLRSPSLYSSTARQVSYDGKANAESSTLSYSYKYGYVPCMKIKVINKITFDSNGGSQVNDIIQFCDTAIVAPIEPTKENYTFAGWYTDNGIFENAFEFDVMPASDLTLYAKWLWNGSEDFKKKGYYRSGDYVYFGEYPQTIKIDLVTITDTVDDRGYYLGSDGEYYAKITAQLSSSYVFSDGSKVANKATYYFKVEPIKWRILEDNNEYATILCDNIIENQAFQIDKDNTGEYAKYDDSSIRKWLNKEFYSKTFSTMQQALIETIAVDNSARSTNPDNNATAINNGENEYSCSNTQDKIWLPSLQEATKSGYGFNSLYTNADAARMKIASDYTRALGILMQTDKSDYGASYWRLRSLGYASVYNNFVVKYDGSIEYRNTAFCFGIAPALKIKLS